MLRNLKYKNSDKEYPANIGQKWTDEEETLLLNDLSKNIEIYHIAETYKRTTGGINARRQEIAYKLYINNISMEEIILKTKLDEVQIIEIIKKKQNNSKKYKSLPEIKDKSVIETEINEMKNDIKELKNKMNELIEMIKSIYRFKDV